MDSRKPFKIVVAEPFASEAISRLEEIGNVTILGNSAPDTLIAALPDADALLVRGKAHVTARIIAAAPRLKVIGRASPNIDHIDLRAAGRRDIHVVYSPLVAVNSCAEFTLGLILAVHRRILCYDRDLRTGKFETLRRPAGREIGQETIGLLGIDPVAEKLGTMLSAAFGCKILYHDPSGNQPASFQAESVGFDALLGNSDILSIHLRLTKETRGLLNAQRIGKMKSTAMLVNTSRGAVVDTIALAEALDKHEIAGAALDVFEAEPLPSHHPLRKPSLNCILTPHVAGATLDAAEGRFNVADDVVRVLQGEHPEHAAKLPPE